jgi:hypothetical protein
VLETGSRDTICDLLKLFDAKFMRRYDNCASGRKSRQARRGFW